MELIPSFILSPYCLVLSFSNGENLVRLLLKLAACLYNFAKPEPLRFSKETLFNLLFIIWCKTSRLILEQDLRQGAGHELRMKFCAVHSSSALAVNTFAPFKNRPGDLVLLGQSGFDLLTFEKTLEIGLGGTPPTLDVFLQRGTEVVAIESKFLEYFTPTQAEFADSYTRNALPWAEDCWWRVLEDAPKAGKRNLDAAQLVKQYLGLRRLLRESKATSATLLYLFWEPENGSDLAICRQHRSEIEDLAKRVAGSVVAFKGVSYPELWEEWSGVPALVPHVQNLKARYEVRL